MRARLGISIALLGVGCADILGIQDRYFEGGVTDSSSDAPVTDAPSDSVVIDGGSNCGTCTQNGAGCEVIACKQDTPTAITVNGSKVLWTNSSPLGNNNSVIAAPIAGGPTTVAYAAGGVELPSIVTLAGESYVATFFGGTVVWIPGDGGAAKPIDSAPYVQALNVDPISNLLVYGSFASNGGVYMCGTLPTGCTGYQAVVNQANVQGVAIDSSNVYFSTTTNTPGIYKCPWVAQCNAPTLVDSSPKPTLVSVDGTFVYWVDDNGSSASLYRANKSDGTNKIGLASASGSILGFVVDGGYVYYAVADSVAGKVAKVKSDGSNAADLATGLQTGAGVAVDSTHAYFTEWGVLFADGGPVAEGRVMRVPR